MSLRKTLAAWRTRSSLLAALFLTLAAPVGAKTILIDFGPNNNTDGNVTPSGTPAINPGNGSTGVADANGNYWNNVVGAGGTGGPVSSTYVNFVDTTNAATPIGMTVGTGWKSNGKANGGLLAPTAARLGNFAIATATQDYFYVEGTAATATVQINGLDPARLYNLRFFGTRNTTSVRRSTYTVSGGNGSFSTTLQTSGPGLGNGTGGADGTDTYDGNNRTIASIAGVQTDSTSQLTVRLTVAEGGFAYLGVLEISEGDPAPPIASKVVRVDFGRNNGTDGNITTSPDAFGNYWNNFTGDFTVPSGRSVANLVTTTNAPTNLALTLTSAWGANGITTGGLLAPTSARLGDLAVPTATQDYFYIEGAAATGTIKVSGLDPAKLYNFRFFGSRNITTVRRSTYTVTAGNGSFSGTLQTSGTGIGNGAGGADGTDIYDGNNRSTVALGGIQADSTGQATIQLSVAEGGFAYLGILEIVEGVTVPVLPPVTVTDLIDRWVAQDNLDPVAPGSVLFVGSSSIRRWESLTRDFPEYRITQRGFGGSQFSDLIPIVNKIVLPYQPSAIVVFEGTNDIRVGNKTGETVLADFKTFINSVRAQQPNVPICYLGITPCPSFFYNADHDPRRRTANSLIRAYCESDPNLKLHFFDTNSFFDNLHDTNPTAWNSYFVDDTHLNRAGYAQWLSVVRPALLSVVAADKTYTANPAALASGDKLLFDFGPSDTTNGDITLSPDVNGNYWNNWHRTNNAGLINSGEHLANLVRTSGTGTGIRMTITGGFLCTGKSGAGGLFAPQASFLGDLAIESATEDFFYSTANDINDATNDDVPGGFMLSGLNPNLQYEFRFLGSRNTTETRVTEFALYGANQKKVNLTTSGTGIGSTGGNANDNQLAILSGMRPDAYGQLFIDLTLIQGSNTHLNAMEILVSSPQTTFESWRADKFTSTELGNSTLEATVWGATADPDGDGLSNLLEYALGTDPRAGNLSPVTMGIETSGTDSLLTLSYRRRQSPTDVAYQIQGSVNLIDWTDVADTLVSSAGGFDQRKASVIRTGIPAQWLRLKVTQTPP